MRRANQIGNRNPLSQSLSRRPTADKELEKLWARDCYSAGESRTQISFYVLKCEIWFVALWNGLRGKQRGLLSDWLIDCLAPRFLLRARDRKIINRNGGRWEGEFSRFV